MPPADATHHDRMAARSIGMTTSRVEKQSPWCIGAFMYGPKSVTHSQRPTASGSIIAVKNEDGSSSMVSTFLPWKTTLFPCQWLVWRSTCRRTNAHVRAEKHGHRSVPKHRYMETALPLRRLCHSTLRLKERPTQTKKQKRDSLAGGASATRLRTSVP